MRFCVQSPWDFPEGSAIKIDSSTVFPKYGVDSGAFLGRAELQRQFDRADHLPTCFSGGVQAVWACSQMVGTKMRLVSDLMIGMRPE